MSFALAFFEAWLPALISIGLLIAFLVAMERKKV